MASLIGLRKKTFEAFFSLNFFSIYPARGTKEGENVEWEPQQQLRVRIVRLSDSADVYIIALCKVLPPWKAYGSFRVPL